MNSWRPIGIIGGMGPAATADFLSRLVVAVGATGDSGHPRVFVDSNPHVPDRTSARAAMGPSPGPALAAMAQGLVAQGAEVLAMPCNAAHGWADDIRAAVPVPFVDIVATAVAVVLKKPVRKVGLLAIGATLDARLYHDRLAAAGVATVDPDRAAVEALVARIKAGDSGADVRDAMAQQAAFLVDAGAEAIIAACTEIPLVLDAAAVNVPFVDATQTLVDALLIAALLH
jgi:aspartate racemase